MSTEDRRAPGAARISFEGLVEVGGTLGPSFEAQAVNVSEEGMQLRTAYLPDLGQQVTCRFEAAPNESIIGSGEVVWCRGAEKGGEFGIRFTDIDADSVEALKHVCGLGADATQPQHGAKVRLYIEGLASPMRAKIRDCRPTAITVGSDLGFLQVGKQLELEDAQTGTKRPASIDHVEVAVDPASNVPQLVVTLRYSDVAADGQTGEAGANEPSDAARSDDAPSDDGASIPMRGAFATQAARLGPSVRRLVNRAKLTIALLAQRRRSEDESVRRRTTAPAPSGGLHATGRRVVRGETGAPGDGKLSTSRRGQHADDVQHTEAAPKSIGRRAAVAGGVMLFAVLGAVALKKSHHEAPSVATAAPNPAEVPAATASAAPATASAPASAAPQPVTTEISPAAAAPPSPGMASETPSSAGPTNTADEGVDGSHPAAHKKRARVAPFGNGPVHHGNVLRLRMDGPIESIEGAQQPTGFEVKVPGHRSLEAAAPLAARDSRIATIKVNNESSGAMLTVAFKDGVPNYQVSAKGDTLVIALAPIGPMEATVAKRDDRSAKSAKHGTRTRDETPER